MSDSTRALRLQHCTVEGCTRKIFARRMCGSHYRRWWRHGDPLKGSTDHGAVQRWLTAALALETDDCILFPFAAKRGRGVVRVGEKLQQAHRYVLAMATGVDHLDLEAAHECGNGACCNKRHLRWDTHAGNMADTIAHGTSTRGEKNARHKLKTHEVRRIKTALKRGASRHTLAREHGVSDSAIHLIAQERNWGWLK